MLLQGLFVLGPGRTHHGLHDGSVRLRGKLSFLRSAFICVHSAHGLANACADQARAKRQVRQQHPASVLRISLTALSFTGRAESVHISSLLASLSRPHVLWFFGDVIVFGMGMAIVERLLFLYLINDLKVHYIVAIIRLTA